MTTSDKNTDEDDCYKILRLLKYLNVKIGLKLTLCVDDLYIVKWCVDASYDVHTDCKGHTGAMMYLGKGNISIFKENKGHKAGYPRRIRLLEHIYEWG